MDDKVRHEHNRWWCGVCYHLASSIFSSLSMNIIGGDAGTMGTPYSSNGSSLGAVENALDRSAGTSRMVTDSQSSGKGLPGRGCEEWLTEREERG